MEPRESDISQGLSSGLSRIRSTLGKPYSLDEMAELGAKIVEAFRLYPDEVNERFVELFAEMAAISESSRLYFGFPALTVDDLTAFLPQAANFFNSFTHK